jgi:hypothetical protein
MAPAARLRRVAVQLRSFAELHGAELGRLADELEASGAGELAGRLRLYLAIQRDESRLAQEELEDIRAQIEAGATGAA